MISGCIPRNPDQEQDSRVNTKEQRARQIQAAIRAILLRDWDPIGIYGEGPDDEYDSYIGGVYRLLATGTSTNEIAEHLRKIEEEAMGVQPRSHETLLDVALKLRGLDIRLDEGKQDSQDT